MYTCQVVQTQSYSSHLSHSLEGIFITGWRKQPWLDLWTFISIYSVYNSPVSVYSSNYFAFPIGLRTVSIFHVNLIQFHVNLIAWTWPILDLSSTCSDTLSIMQMERKVINRVICTIILAKPSYDFTLRSCHYAHTQDLVYVSRHECKVRIHLF